VECYLINH